MAELKKSNGLGKTARLWILGLSFAIASLLGSHKAAAAIHHHHFRHGHSYVALRHGREYRHLEYAYSRREYREARFSYHRHFYHEYYGDRYETAEYRIYRLRHTRYRYSGIQCVPYAREVSHIELSGNAFLWWAEAAGRYARGDTPVEGAVLNFRAIGRMPLGHVAVVTSVVNSRTILVTQANWVRGAITNDVTMQDVSPNNDWTQVQVELGDSSTWGAAYPTYGFIYNQSANSTVIASSTPNTEVAEAPAAPVLSTDAPDRNLQ